MVRRCDASAYNRSHSAGQAGGSPICRFFLFVAFRSPRRHAHGIDASSIAAPESPAQAGDSAKH